MNYLILICVFLCIHTNNLQNEPLSMLAESLEALCKPTEDLFQAINSGDIDKALDIFKKHEDEINLRARDYQNLNNTLLHAAVEMIGQVDFDNIYHLIVLLHNKGADRLVKNDNDDTPLHLAAQKGNQAKIMDFVQLLWPHYRPIPVNEKNSQGETPLHKALQNHFDSLNKNSRKTNLELIKYFLVREANINEQDNQGNTPLHFAAEQGNYDAIPVLLQNNAKINIRNNDNKTPLMVAQNSFAKTASIAADELKKKGAQ